MSATNMIRRFAPLLIFANIVFVFAAIKVTSIYYVPKIPGFNYRNRLRFDQLLEQLPHLTENSTQTTLFFGSSTTEYFLDPLAFDNAMKKYGHESKSYNLAFEGMAGPGQFAFFSRIDAEFRKRGARFQNVIVELAPASMNIRFSDRHREMQEILMPATFMNTPAFLKMAQYDLPSAANLFFDFILRPTSWPLVNQVRLFIVQKEMPKSIEWAGATKLWSKPEFYERPEWNPGTRGLANWNLPQSKDLFERAIAELHQAENWDEMISSFRRGNGVDPQFEFNRQVIELFIKSVNLARHFAERVYVVVFPVAPSYQHYVEQYVDANYVIQKVARETSAQILDLRNVRPTRDEDFADAIHLRHSTFIPYLEIIAEKLSGPSIAPSNDGS